MVDDDALASELEGVIDKDAIGPDTCTAAGIDGTAKPCFDRFVFSMTTGVETNVNGLMGNGVSKRHITQRGME